MFKSIFTTRMSDNRKTLKRRFEKINSKISLKAKVLALVLTLLIAVLVAVVILFLSGTEFTLGNRENTAYELIVHDENPDVEYDELYEVIFRKDNGEVLYTKTFDYRYAIEEIGEGVYNVRSWGGTNVSFDVFVDTKNDRVSEEYFNLLCYEGETVVYCSPDAVVIDEMFGTDKLCIYKDTRDFSETFDLSSAITYAEIKDGKLCLKYLTGADFKEVYEEFILWERVEEEHSIPVTPDISQTTRIAVSILLDSENIVLENKPFYYNGDIYVPLEETFNKIGEMEQIETKFEYSGDKIKLKYTDKSGDWLEFDMEVGKNYIDGDNEFMPVTEPVNAPFYYNAVVYIPMEYVYSMYFYDIVIDYRLIGDSPFIEKINDAIKFEEEARSWAPEGFTQQDLNNKAYEAFDNWRKLLNEIMAEVNDELEIDHPAWAKQCDRYMENEASPYEGGSMQPMVEYYAGAHFTRKRCEQLVIEYLSQKGENDV